MRYVIDPKSRTEHEDGSVSWYTPMPFRSLAKVEKALCGDGERRTAFITGEPDTYFSVPAYITWKGKRLRGYVTHEDASWKFRHYPLSEVGRNFDFARGVVYCPVASTLGYDKREARIGDFVTLEDARNLWGRIIELKSPTYIRVRVFMPWHTWEVDMGTSLVLRVIDREHVTKALLQVTGGDVPCPFCKMPSGFGERCMNCGAL